MPDTGFNAPRFRTIVAILAVLVAGAIVRFVTLPTEVQVVNLERRDIVETLVVVGRVRAPSRAALGTAIAGTVADVRVREGDRVAGGDVLLLLEQREAAAAVQQSEAALVETQATVEQAVAEAEREATQSQRDLERIESVVAEGGLTQQRLDLARQQAQDARSRLDALRAQGEGGEPASIARVRAALELARARLAQTRITAPADGTVLARLVEPGDVVSPGLALLDIAFEGPHELVAFPGEENLGRLTRGSHALASADAFPDEAFQALVTLVAPSVDPSQGTVEVRLSIVDPPAYLIPDMTVSVNIETGRKSAAAVLPADAVQGLGTSQPWVGVVQDGRLVRIDVTTGLRPPDFVEIVSELPEDSQIVVSADPDEVGNRVRVEGREDTVAPAGSGS